MPDDTTCTLNGCGRKLAYKGALLCRRHYDERDDKRSYFQGTLEERFWHYTEVTGPGECWLWTGTQDGKGYGLIWDVDAGANRYAHVVSWELNRGEKLPEDEVIRHAVCDTPLCVNAEHLLSGTHADNVADKVSRERQSRGGEHGLAKLTEEQVREIRRAYATGAWSQRRLARRFQVTQPNIQSIVNRNSWTHI